MSRSLVQRLQSRLLDATNAFSARYTFAGLRDSFLQQHRIWQPRLLKGLDALPYQLVHRSKRDFAALDPLEQIRWALRRPVPVELPHLPTLLQQQVFRQPNSPPKKGEVQKVIEDRLAFYRQAHHHERLEFVGDRVLGLVAAVSCHLLAPMRPLPTPNALPSLTWEQATFADLSSNALAAQFARRFDFGARCQDARMVDKHLADRWEAYLAALFLAQGWQGLLEFLAPLLRERLGRLHGSTGTMPPLRLNELARLEDTSQSEPEHAGSVWSGSSTKPALPSPPSSSTSHTSTPSLAASSASSTTVTTSPSAASSRATTSKFEPLQYATLAVARVAFIRDFIRQGASLRRTKAAQRLIIPGQQGLNVVKNRTSYSKAHKPDSALLLQAISRGLVVIKESEPSKTEPLTPVGEPSMPSASSGAASVPAQPPFAPLQYPNKRDARSRFLSDLARHGLAFKRDPATRDRTLQVPGFEMMSFQHGQFKRLIDEAIEVGLIIVKSSVQIEGATKDATELPVVSASASPSATSLPPKPPSLPLTAWTASEVSSSPSAGLHALSPPSDDAIFSALATPPPVECSPSPQEPLSGTIELPAANSASNIAFDTTPEPSPPSDVAILSALTSPPPVDDSPPSPQPPTQDPTPPTISSSSQKNPILVALLQKALRDEAQSDDVVESGMKKARGDGEGGSTALYREGSGRREESAVRKQQSWAAAEEEEEPKPSAKQTKEP